MAFDVGPMLSRMAEARQRQLDAAQKAVDVFAEQVIGDAQQLAPVLTGALQASGTTLPIQVEGDTVHKEIGFNTDYGAAVHENLEANHAVGQAKFLTVPLQQSASKLGPFVADRVKGAMG